MISFLQTLAFSIGWIAPFSSCNIMDGVCDPVQINPIVSALLIMVLWSASLTRTLSFIHELNLINSNVRCNIKTLLLWIFQLLWSEWFEDGANIYFDYLINCLSYNIYFINNQTPLVYSIKNSGEENFKNVRTGSPKIASIFRGQHFEKHVAQKCVKYTFFTNQCPVVYMIEKCFCRGNIKSSLNNFFVNVISPI